MASESTYTVHTPSADSASPSLSSDPQRKRSFAASEASENRRKAPKVTRACDRCKSRKAKCSGTNPCATCAARNEACTWDLKYSRGLAKPPPLSYPHGPVNDGILRQTEPQLVPEQQQRVTVDPEESITTSRASPDVESARIRGVYYDSTSGLAFVHRAYRRLSMRQNQHLSNTSSSGDKQQPLTSAGDWPPIQVDPTSLWQSFPSRRQAEEHIQFYYEHCVVTYRFLHRQSVDSWLDTLLSNLENGLPPHNLIGTAKAAIVTTIFGIVTFRKEQINSVDATDGTRNFATSDGFFLAAKALTDDETGLPRLESVQARLVQVLYLLQTARMNQAWYILGHAHQIISALGMHRRLHSIWDETPRTPGRDYINLQCRKRTFWTAYTLDKYLCIVLGRPTHYHDNDIDQEFPDRINDNDMQAHGPTVAAGSEDCLIDGLIQHAKLARIIGGISSDVYRIQQRPNNEIVSTAHSYAQKLKEWNSKLPIHLGAIKPSSLIPEFRRQAIALRLAYAHARMHANRPFLLGNMRDHSDSPMKLKQNVSDCLEAAEDALQIVNGMAADGSLLYSLWWMYYVAFCALSVVYIWEIQQGVQHFPTSIGVDTAKLLELANQCHGHLSSKAPINSPSRSYSIVLEELREEARQHALHGVSPTGENAGQRCDMTDHGQFENSIQAPGGDNHILLDTSLDQPGLVVPSIWDDWQTTDWLNFDSTVYLPFHDMSSTVLNE